MSTKINHIVFFIFFLIACNSEIYSQNTKPKDSAEVNVKEIIANKKTIQNDSNKKPLLEGIVKRSAKDYEKLDQRKKKLTLYNQAELYYQDFELKSGIIVLDYEKSEVYAGRLKDSTGKYIQYPVFKQGQNVIEPDSIRFNTKTGKALIWNTKTKQGEMNIMSEISKRENDSVLFFQKARFTTSTNLEDPEYYFLAYKAKMVPKKKFVTGLTHMYIANVPTPIGVPFAFFPMTDKNTSGIIIPTPGQNNDRGYFLQNGGYYFALSDYYDLAILGDYYTNGSYALRTESAYAKRYKFNGNVQFRYENQVLGEKGFPGYLRSNQYNIQWTHNQDAKASANSRFSSSVNFGSSKYFRQSINMLNVGSNLTNTMSSSISYSKTIPSLPSINFSVALTHNQNTNNEVVNLTLPSFNASVDNIFPFAKQDDIKKGFFQNINFQYNIKGENKIKTTEDAMFKSQMFENALSGISHSIPLTTNFKLFRYFSVTTGTNYTENWVFNTTEKSYNSSTDLIEDKRINGFESFRTYNFTSSIGTTIYGTYTFKETSKIKGIRHLMKPSIGYGYAPSFDKYYNTFLNKLGQFESYSRFENSLYNAPVLGINNSINFRLENSLEAKVIDKKSTKGETKKISLLNQFNLDVGYNFAAEEFKMTNIGLIGGTTLLDNKLQINFNATFDPYDLDENNNKINEFAISNGNGLARMVNSGINLIYSVSNNDFSNSKESKQTVQNGGRSDDLFGTAKDLSNQNESLFKKDDAQNKLTELYNYKFPWDLRIGYTLTFSNNENNRKIENNSLMFSGNIDLAVRWKFNFNSGYDFAQKGIIFTNLGFERDLESWRMSFNIVPIGIYSYWNFFIGIKSSMLSDIKWDKRKLPDPRLR
ncbi:putative LPS assembly protein LptD [Flavobacterium urocaniciphilum]|uniref:LPS assembly outer membrane protein LptD (Organic solvent tolerance protein OstA) n=1 Tax=Flavobacterium urocaniciphilum TaxID=1299341 RepID=A0A1H8ZG36_9FLAO|nr:putative LPS assembly protein LptD [Flavobacterium urocaniciphilum]SEP63334.1 LPS assembly outer membrane protein LptD (organic solvent tolerance protein OstA) [Flavobacterium urocaniciphilum]